MKSRYSTIDICAIIKELKGFLGLRVVNVYDVDNKTYLIKLSRPDEKAVILLESGTRLHSTEFEWPKNPAPSGFSMKMRKHLKGRRFESLNQLGIDRIVDLQFGSGEAAYHVIVELYDRGNLILTDFEYTILNILRPRTDNSQDVRFAVREKYPVENAKQHQPPTGEKLREVLQQGKDGDPLKKLLIPQLDYGPAVIEHCLLGAGFTENVRIGKGFSLDEDFSKILAAVTEAESLLKTLQEKACKGYIIQKKEKRVNPQEGESDELLTYEEFHPFLFRQHEKSTQVEFSSFDRACDEFFSKLESQRLDLKTLQQEKAAMKKLENVKKDHEKRLHSLQKEQEDDTLRGQLIEMNLQLVDQALLIVRSALANQIDWTEIWRLVKEAQAGGDPVASCIKGLKLDTNHITMLLRDPYSDELEEGEEYEPLRPMKVDIDLSLSAYANSRKYFDMKRTKAKKEQKTMDASKKAMKSAEHKTKQALKEVATVASINKARKTYWFEKFQWFVSSENFLVIGGRDQQQNELIVKRYMKPGDVYVHADLHGASSVVVKNPSGEPVPPKTLTEAGTMAICNSAAWDAKVVTSAWWVHHHQVSKTAPTGEYLTTGSFMIRGKKNYLPPSYLVYGFGILFKLEDGSVERHRGERRIRGAEEDEASVADTLSTTENDAALDALSEEDTESGEEGEEEQEKREQKEEKQVGEEQELKEEKQEEEEAAEAEAAEGEEEKEEKEEESSESEEESAFPDTSISLQHVEGSKFALQRGTSTSSTTSTVSETGGATVFMGDDQPVTLGPRLSGTGSKLSAKQRREMRKQKKAQHQQQHESTQDAEEDAVSWLHDKNASHAEGGRAPVSLEKDHHTDQQKQGPAKRGQKSKLKKIKEKYADQDEEERKLRMEILASAGSQKEEKRKKGKKGKEQAKGGPKSGGGRPQSGRPQSGRPQVHLDTASQQLQQLNLDSAADASQEEGSAKPEHSKAKPVEEHDGSDDEKDDTTQTQDDFHIVDSLTGVPVSEDELLFAVPVCAPYSAIVNYKYKVKLLPGSTKKGKAAKIALNMFQHDKTTTSREKDLLRILKDQDVSRNMPGKVRVAAPNLQKVRK